MYTEFRLKLKRRRRDHVELPASSLIEWLQDVVSFHLDISSLKDPGFITALKDALLLECLSSCETWSLGVVAADSFGMIIHSKCL